MIDFAKARRNMVDNQVRPFDVTDRAVLAALDAVERERFLPASALPLAYLDRAIEVAAGRRLLTPMVFARLLQALAIAPTDRVLDVACGLGYSTATLAALAAEVVGVETDAALARDAQARLAAAGVGNARVVAAPLDKPPGESFDAVLVNGAVEVVPESWTAALAEGGRLACVRGVGRAAHAILVTRVGAHLSERILFDAAAPTLAQFGKKPEFTF